jgi:hypothetical protein
VTERARDKDTATDPVALAQEALRESYLQATEDLRSIAAKVRASNESRKAIRAYVAALRDIGTKVAAAARQRGVGQRGADQRTAAVVAELFGQNARAYTADEAMSVIRTIGGG